MSVFKSTADEKMYWGFCLWVDFLIFYLWLCWHRSTSFHGGPELNCLPTFISMCRKHPRFQYHYSTRMGASLANADCWQREEGAKCLQRWQFVRAAPAAFKYNIFTSLKPPGRWMLSANWRAPVSPMMMHLNINFSFWEVSLRISLFICKKYPVRVWFVSRG